MKKILSFGMLLAVLLTLGLTGCKSDPDALPGIWLDVTDFYQGATNQPFKIGTVAVSDQTVTYELQQPANIADADKIEKGYYRSSCYYWTKEAKFTGFKASVKSNAYGGCGFIFNQSNVGDVWSYYYLYINSTGSFKIDQVVTDVSTPVKDFTKTDALKPFGDKDEVLVYTDKNGDIIVKINNKQVAVIKNPVLKNGRVGTVFTVSYEDVQKDTPIKSVYDFKQFQYY